MKRNKRMTSRATPYTWLPLMRVLRLVEDLKREKEEALKKVLELERQLDAKLKLDMEIEELEGKLQVMKLLGDEDDAAVQQKIKDVNNELQTKMEEMEDIDNLNQTLVVQERQSNDELQEARKELIKDMLSGLTNIMGEINMKAFHEAIETGKMQRLAEEHVRVLNEQEKLNAELEKLRKKHDSWCKELNKRVALIEQEKPKLDEEKKEREKEVALKKALELERQLDAKLKLEAEIEELKGKLQVMKHLGDEDDAAAQQKIKETKNELQTRVEEMDDMEYLIMVKERQTELEEALKELVKGKLQAMKHFFGDEDDAAVQETIEERNNELPRKMEEMDYMENLNQTLMVKERQTNDELQEAYKELIKSWRTSIRNNPDWRVVQVDDDHKEVINENDKLLKNLKAERGHGKFDAVVTAFKEMNEYNPSGRYIVNKLWNFKDSQKATMKVEKRISLLLKLLLLMMVLFLMSGVIMSTTVPRLLTLP